ncbi:helix-turn-helix domain-containing protein [Lampropedia puyangensis]|uniref:Helix-turn-helix domain-containing protein n=1 Tax=Lampropedia puyangensis TaxID=1330072 RepID=A0A4S8EPD3_9BURK|nr:helix-turn-helix domain-containing protein [Lampropedia puyangensis]THT96068.1 helix-turn-helix domain-containing protein [Lampropedia puyangensis]
MAVNYSKPIPQKFLSNRQIKAVIALAEGMTQADAAKFAGTSPQTVTAWMQDPAFHKHLRRKALRVFTDGLDSPNPSQRMWAAKEVLARIPADPDEEAEALNRSICADVMATEGLPASHSTWRDRHV